MIVLGRNPTAADRAAYEADQKWRAMHPPTLAARLAVHARAMERERKIRERRRREERERIRYGCAVEIADGPPYTASEIARALSIPIGAARELARRLAPGAPDRITAPGDVIAFAIDHASWREPDAALLAALPGTIRQIADRTGASYETSRRRMLIAGVVKVGTLPSPSGGGRPQTIWGLPFPSGSDRLGRTLGEGT